MGFGIYEDLLARGKLKEKDREPNISGLEYYIDAFRELSTARPSSLGVGQIPFTAVVEYFKIFPSDEFDEFLYLMRLMDKSYVEFEKAKAAKKEAQK